MIKLSIIIPVFNGAKYIKKCIDSFLIDNEVQNDCYEIIIVDDGSNDSTVDICYNLKKEHSFIKILRNKKSGVSSARNLGISIAKGEYIAFCDADDFVVKGYIATIINLLNKYQGVDLLIYGYSSLTEQNVSTNILHAFKFDNVELFKSIMCDDRIGGFVWNKIYKKKIISEIRFCEDMDICEDLFFNIEILMKEHDLNIVYFAESLYFYMTNIDSSSRNVRNLFDQNDNLKYSVAFNKVKNLVPQSLHRYVNSRIFSSALNVYLMNVVQNRLTKRQHDILKKDMRGSVYSFLRNDKLNSFLRIKYLLFLFFPHIKKLTNK